MQIEKYNADQEVVNTLQIVLEIVSFLKIRYVIFGSCALQTYLDHFYRLPNDIDLVLTEEDTLLFLSECERRGHPIHSEQGRYRAYIDDFPIHIIPEVFTVINKADKSILGKVSFTDALNSAPTKRVNLLNSSFSIEIKVMNLEYCFLMELSRRQNTNTFMSIYYLLTNRELDVVEVYKLVSEHYFLIERAKLSISDFLHMLTGFRFADEIDVAFVRIKALEVQKHLRSIELSHIG